MNPTCTINKASVSSHRLNILFLSVIVLALGIEYVGYEGIFTVYRLLILPLSILVSFSLLKNILTRPGGYSIILLSFFLLYIIASTVLKSGIGGSIPALSFLFILPFLGAWGGGLVLDYPIKYSKILLLWGLPHLFAFLFLPDPYQGWSQRFTGLHSDSNFCGMYLTFSFISALYFLLTKQSKLWKLTALVLFLLDAYLITKTQSRTTLLTCIAGSGALVLFLIKKFCP